MNIRTYYIFCGACSRWESDEGKLRVSAHRCHRKDEKRIGAVRAETVKQALWKAGDQIAAHEHTW